MSGLRRELRPIPGRGDERDAAKQVLVAIAALATPVAAAIAWWWSAIART